MNERSFHPSVYNVRVESGRERLAAALVGGFGVVTLLVHVVHLANHDLPALGVVFGVALPMGFSVALIGSAAWLLEAGFGDHALRITLWCLVGALVLVAAGSVIVVFQFAMGDRPVGVGFVLCTQATVGGLLGFLLGVYDTQRLVIRRELLAERETASRLGRRLTVLNRVLRHDVRNAVNVIRGNAELVLGGTNDPQLVTETIREKASEMARLSEQARDIEGALSMDAVDTEPVDLGTVVAGKALAFQSRHGYASVHRSIDDVWADTTPLVETAVEKLLENAIEHNDATEPSVWVDVSAGVRDGRPVAVVRIEDDGPGIPSEQVDVIQRGRETALEHTSGLGLWLVHWIVTESGGQVHFEERTPEGSVVELVLPRAEPVAADRTG